MDFLELAKNRYSVRKFKKESIDDSVINQILEAAMVAPTACNNQPIKIYVSKSEESKNKIHKCTGSHFYAPLFMVVCYDNTQCWKRSFDGKTSGEIDASIVATHIMLEAYSLGVGSTWVMNFNPSMLVKELNMPSNIIPTVLLPIGYPAQDVLPSIEHNTYKDINSIVEII